MVAAKAQIHAMKAVAAIAVGKPVGAAVAVRKPVAAAREKPKASGLNTPSEETRTAK